MKSKVAKLNVDKIVPVSVDLSKLSDITNLATNTTHNAKTNDEVKGEIPCVTNLAISTALNAKITEVKNKIPYITSWATNNALISVENKIPNISNFVKKLTVTRNLTLEIKLLLIIIMINILLLKNLKN